jgi:hypothetical protein
MVPSKSSSSSSLVLAIAHPLISAILILLLPSTTTGNVAIQSSLKGGYLTAHAPDAPLTIESVNLTASDKWEVDVIEQVIKYHVPFSLTHSQLCASFNISDRILYGEFVDSNQVPGYCNNISFSYTRSRCLQSSLILASGIAGMICWKVQENDTIKLVACPLSCFATSDGDIIDAFKFTIIIV